MQEDIHVKRETARRIMFLAVIVGAIAAFHLSGLGNYLTLSSLKESQSKFEIMYADHRCAVIAAYLVIYIVAATLSLPGAILLTIAGGALFGLWTGTIVVSFASSIGATLACFVSRFILRDWLQKKLGERLRMVNERFEKEGAFYLFTLRLVPVFPFWLINLTMGLTKMPMRTFYWVSQTGMLPGTLVYVNAGTELGKIESLAGIFSPALILSLVILGLFPITTKKLLTLYKSRKKGPQVPV